MLIFSWSGKPQRNITWHYLELLALFGAPLDPGGSVMAQEQQKMYMQVKTKTVTDADPYSAQEQSAPETNSMQAQTLSS